MAMFKLGKLPPQTLSGCEAQSGGHRAQGAERGTQSAERRAQRAERGTQSAESSHTPCAMRRVSSPCAMLFALCTIEPHTHLNGDKENG